MPVIRRKATSGTTKVTPGKVTATTGKADATAYKAKVVAKKAEAIPQKARVKANNSDEVTHTNVGIQPKQQIKLKLTYKNKERDSLRWAAIHRAAERKNAKRRAARAKTAEERAAETKTTTKAVSKVVYPTPPTSCQALPIDPVEAVSDRSYDPEMLEAAEILMSIYTQQVDSIKRQGL